jgi:hypothetical protein
MGEGPYSTLAGAALCAAALLAAHLAFIKAASFARPSGVNRRSFFRAGAAAFVFSAGLSFVGFRFDLAARGWEAAVNFRCSFASFFASFAMLAARRLILFLRFFSFIDGSWIFLLPSGVAFQISATDKEHHAIQRVLWARGCRRMAT